MKSSNKKVNSNKNEYTLLCRHFISCGICPFRNKCKYIHPIEIPPIQTNEPCILVTQWPKKRDGLFWPSLDKKYIKNQEPNQCYENAFDEEYEYKYDFTVMTIWNTFVCNLNNEFIDVERLPIFEELEVENCNTSDEVFML